MKTSAVALALGFLFPVAAFGQGLAVMPDVESGNWSALHHSPDQGVHTDICLAMSSGGALVFRGDANDLEIRSGNAQWSMSAGQQGEMNITIGNYSHDFKMTAAGASMLAVVVTPDEMKPLLDAMDSAGQAVIKYGQKTTRVVSLLGSTKVLNQFRSCVATSGFADLGNAAGANASPF